MPWFGTRPDTNRAVGPDRNRGFLDRCPSRRAQQRSTWSARSAARTNEVGRDEQRRTIGRRGSSERSRAGTSQPVLPVRRWTARRAGPHADLTMADTPVLRRS